MGSLTHRADPSGGSGATTEGDGSDGAVDAATSTAPVDDTVGASADPAANAEPFDAQSLNDGREHLSIEQYTSPLPPPEVMGGYEAVQAGAFDRILRLTEQEQAHRISEDEREGAHRRTVVERDQTAGIADQKRGMYLGTLVVAIVVSGVVGCAWIGQPWPAVVLAAGASGIIGIFAWRQRRGNAADQSRP